MDLALSPSQPSKLRVAGIVFTLILVGGPEPMPTTTTESHPTGTAPVGDTASETWHILRDLSGKYVFGL